MAFKHGKATELLLDGADISTYFNKADTSVSVETADTTTFKANWKTAIPGRAAAGFEAAGLFDPTFTDITGILGDAPGAVLSVAPAGATAVGDMVRLVRVLSTKYKESSPVGNVVAFNWGVTADGEVGFGRVLVPLTSFTVDANGATLDGGAQTTTGAIAHLHVTAVSASDSVVVTIQDDTTSNFSGTPATIGTFAAKSAVGAQRLVIAGTIRRYVRAVIDVTGADVAISLSVALART